MLEAASGAEAVALSAAFPKHIHLVISDVVMPGMGGPEVVLRLREQRSTLKALFTSGFTDDEILRREITSSTVQLLEKPFAPADLVKAARRAMSFE